MSLVITGDEEVIRPREPEGALAEYYRAFNSRDLKLMEANWLGDEATIYHPLGGVRRGWDEIRQLYEQILCGPSGINMSFHDISIERYGDTFLALGLERGLLRTVGDVVTFRVRTSRLFVWRGGRWRQVHHHGSIEEPEALAHYLTMILTGQTAPAMA